MDESFYDYCKSRNFPVDGSVTYKNRQYNFVNGLLHSVDDKPALIVDDIIPEKTWFKNGVVHRDSRDENGFLNPAIVHENDVDCAEVEPFYIKMWFQNGKKHNPDMVDGKYLPAVIDTTGNDSVYEYWINGVEIFQ
jgi:hypothetical protein